MKKFKLTFIILAALTLTLLLAACGKPEIYTVTFDPNGGSILSGEGVQTVEQGQSATPPTPERRDYAFDGWDGSWEAVTGDVTVRAKWMPVFNVKFDPNGGNVTDTSLLSQTVRQGEAAVVPEMTAREGYEFDGWDTDVSSITENITSKAKWTRIYEVTYVMMGGKTEDKHLIKQTIRADEQPTAPTVTRARHTFLGWDEKINEQKGTITYSATWEANTLTPTEISALVNPATVEVTAYRRGGMEFGMGSGFFIDAEGTLITSFYVIDEAYEFKVKLADSTEYNITHVIAYDIDKDIAILKADLGGKTVPYLTLSDQRPVVGDPVYAIGSSLGLTGTFSSGIVSYLDREVDGVKYIQSTAPLSDGNYGGPLVDQYGEVIGVNSASYADGQNLNLSVTVNEINEIKNVNLTSEQFFESVVIFKYFIGEQIKKEVEKDNVSQECPDGYTVEGKITDAEDMDIYMTKVDADTDYIAIMIGTKTYEELYYVIAVLGCARSSSASSSSIQSLETADFDQYIAMGPDNTYLLTVIVEIPDDLYSRGYTYYGAAVFNLNGALDYQYFAYGLTEAEYKAYMGE
ncbi:MAG: trypsin-like peptidase domain-containing protein [Clostridia bacterium]|nr:trypsin-like peptidase domain-containing protein [Clostridia bacterium]